MAMSVLIAGGGPAGSSLAIRLSQQGKRVILVEREKFPRPKLCGEFISPECSIHFEELKIAGRIRSAGGECITETRFYAPNYRSLVVPSSWFGLTDAIGLSRSVMDDILLNAARNEGVDVRDGTSLVTVEFDGTRVHAVGVRSAAMQTENINADVFVDATGRSGFLSKLVQRASGANTSSKSVRPDLVAFKAHLLGALPEKGCCEIYSFPGGYGGLSSVGSGVSNHCFVVDATTARDHGGSADEIVRHIVRKNQRAEETLCNAVKIDGWLAVSISRFGVSKPSFAENAFSVGDAAAFIDPFTGSGILMALESSKCFAESISEYGAVNKELSAAYGHKYRDQFSRRLRVASVLRLASRSPKAAGFLISMLSISGRGLDALTRSTRSSRY